MRKPDSWHLLSIALGASVTAAIFAASIAVFANKLCLEVMNWQTLIAGILAFAGAAWTVSAIRYQIESHRKQEQEQTERKLFAAKAKLPVVLSTVIDWADGSVRQLKTLQPHFAEYDALELPHGYEPPEFRLAPRDIIFDIQLCIEYEQKETERLALVWLLHRIQLIEARLRDLRLTIAERNLYANAAESVTVYIVDCLELSYRSSECFDYARLAQDRINTQLTADALARYARRLGIQSADFPCLDKIIRNYVDADR